MVFNSCIQNLDTICKSVISSGQKVLWYLSRQTVVDETTELPTSKLTSCSMEWCKAVGSEAKTVDDILSGPDAKVGLPVNAMLEAGKLYHTNAMTSYQ